MWNAQTSWKENVWRSGVAEEEEEKEEEERLVG